MFTAVLDGRVLRVGVSSPSSLPRWHLRHSDIAGGGRLDDGYQVLGDSFFPNPRAAFTSCRRSSCVTRPARAACRKHLVLGLQVMDLPDQFPGGWRN